MNTVTSTQFGWKRKASQPLISKTVFDDEDDSALELSDRSLLWLQAAKRSKMHLLEDCEVKSKRLKEEGNILAEEERYWEAIQRWDEAIQLTPGNAVLYELKSQVAEELSLVFSRYKLFKQHRHCLFLMNFIQLLHLLRRLLTWILAGLWHSRH
jgi:tetratricopeptide (TPR) repeat protein